MKLTSCTWEFSEEATPGMTWEFHKENGKVRAIVKTLPHHSQTSMRTLIEEIHQKLTAEDLRRWATVIGGKIPGDLIGLTSAGVKNYRASTSYTDRFSIPYAASADVLKKELQCPILEYFDWWNHLSEELLTNSKEYTIQKWLQDPLLTPMSRVAIYQKLGKHLPEYAKENSSAENEILLLSYKGIEKPYKNKGLIKTTVYYQNKVIIQRETWNGNAMDSAAVLCKAPLSIKETMRIRDLQHLKELMTDLNGMNAKKKNGAYTKEQLEFVGYISAKIDRKPRKYRDLFREIISPELASQAMKFHNYNAWLTPDIFLKTKLKPTNAILSKLRQTIRKTIYKEETQELWDQYGGKIPPFIKEEEEGPKKANLHIVLMKNNTELPNEWLESTEYFPKILEDVCNGKETTLGTRGIGRPQKNFDSLLCRPNTRLAKAILKHPDTPTKKKKELAFAMSSKV